MWTAENTYHTYLHILQNISCIRKPQVISGRGGTHPLHPLPESAPELDPVFPYSLYLTLYKTDISLRWTLYLVPVSKVSVLGRTDYIWLDLTVVTVVTYAAESTILHIDCWKGAMQNPENMDETR